MPEVEFLLHGYKEAADATVFADVEVTEALRERIRRAAIAESRSRVEDCPGTVADPAGFQPPARRAPLARRSLAAVAAVAAIVAAITVALPSGAPAAAALSVTFADRDGVATFDVADLPSAGPDPQAAPEEMPQGTSADVVIDAEYSVWHSWSPDGDRLLYGNGLDLHVYDRSTGSSTNLTNTPERVELMPVWSPDGTRVAFTSRPVEPGEGGESLVGNFGGAPTVVDANGSGYTVLGTGVSTSPPTWSPDNARVAYAVGNELYIHELGEPVGRRVDLGHLAAPVLAAPAWSPVADTVAVYISGSDQDPAREDILAGTAPPVEQAFVLVDLGSGTTTVAHAWQAPFVPRQPARWSSDGRHMALVFRQETSIAEPTGVVIVSVDGATTEITPSGLVTQVAWHPSDDTLAVLDDTDPTTVALYTLQPDGSFTRSNARFDAPLTGIDWAPNP